MCCPGTSARAAKRVAETIENNVRRLIIDETAVNPKYYEKMSDLLDALIRRRKREALDYKRYLAELVELTRKVSSPETQSSYPSSIDSAVLRALFDNLEEPQASAVREPPPPHYGTKPTVKTRETKALALDREIRRVKKADWRGNTFKEREVRNAIKSELRDDEELANTIFEIVRNQRVY